MNQAHTPTTDRSARETPTTASLEQATPKPNRDLAALSREFRERGSQHPHLFLRLFSDRQLLDMMKPILRNPEVVECDLLDGEQRDFLRRYIGRAPNPDGSVLTGKQDTYLYAIVAQVSGYIAEWPTPARLVSATAN